MSEFNSLLNKFLDQIILEDTPEVTPTPVYELETEISMLLRHAREESGLTQKELAEKTGVSQSNLSKIENGAYLPSLTVLKRIATGLDKRLTVQFLSLEEE